MRDAGDGSCWGGGMLGTGDALRSWMLGTLDAVKKGEKTDGNERKGRTWEGHFEGMERKIRRE